MKQNDERRKGNRVRKKGGINNYKWSRMMNGGREIKDMKKGILIIVDGGE
jgi:hypothetical protein